MTPDSQKRLFSVFFRFNAVCGLILLLVLFLVLFLAFGCARVSPPPTAPPGYPKPYKVLGKWYQPIPNAKGFRQRGVASWYGKKFHGKKTASGEIYDMHAVSAAHKTLPLHTHVRVHNLNNNKEVVVRINDRGPFVRGRIVDLSYSAAKQIGIVGPGTARVEIVALGAAKTPEAKSDTGRSYVPVDYYSGDFTIQVGAFKDRSNAQRLKKKLDQTYKNAHISVYDSGKEVLYRVRVGRSSTLEQAIAYESFLIKKGYKDAFVIAE